MPEHDINLRDHTVSLATELTVARLANPNTRASAEDVPAFLQSIYQAVCTLTGASAAADDEPLAPQHAPAVTVRKSLASKDHIVSTIDGKPYKMLRRHLSHHGLTAEQYRQRYGLNADYPMVAESYSSARREMAKTIGLGQNSGQLTSGKGQGDSASKSRGRQKIEADG